MSSEASAGAQEVLDQCALLKKLEQWKEDRERKKMQEQKKLPFISTVGKAIQSKDPVFNSTRPSTSYKSKGLHSHISLLNSQLTNVSTEKETGRKRSGPMLVSKQQKTVRKVNPDNPLSVSTLKKKTGERKQNRNKGSLDYASQSNSCRVAATKMTSLRSTNPGYTNMARTKKGQGLCELVSMPKESKTTAQPNDIDSLKDSFSKSNRFAEPLNKNAGEVVNNNIMNMLPGIHRKQNHCKDNDNSTVLLCKTNEIAPCSTIPYKKAAKGSTWKQAESVLKQNSHGVMLRSTAQGARLGTSLPFSASRKDTKKRPRSTQRVPMMTTFIQKMCEGSSFHKTHGTHTPRAQKDMRYKLNEWQKAKGHMPCNLRHTGCFGCETNTDRLQTSRSLVKASITVEQLAKQESKLTKENFVTDHSATNSSRSLPDDVRLTENAREVDLTEVSQLPTKRSGASLDSQLDKDFEQCLKSIEQGSLSMEAARKWLEDVSKTCSDAHRHAGWYKCQVAALKMSANQDALLAVFEQAIINNAQPAHEVAQLLTDTMKDLLQKGHSRGNKRKCSVSEVNTAQTTKSEHSPCYQPEIQPENAFESTKVKYSVVKVTPFKKRRRGTQREETPVSVITPVRRSARHTPASSALNWQGKLSAVKTPYCEEYSAPEEVPSEERKHMLFHPNQALEPLLKDLSPEMT